MALIVVATGCAGSSGHGSAGVEPRILIDSTGCHPATVEIPTGDHRLGVEDSGGSGMLQIVSDDHVVAELDAIRPGDHLQLDIDLPTGAYGMDCVSGLTDSGGVLLVGESSGAPTIGQAADLAEAMVAYRSYLEDQSAAFDAATARLLAAIRSSNLYLARSTFLSVLALYGHVQAAAGNFSDQLTPGLADLDQAIDPEPGANGSLGGLPALERGLWVSDRTAGLNPAASDLMAAANSLVSRVSVLDLDAIEVANGTTFVLDGVTIEDLTDTGVLLPVEALSVVQGAKEVFTVLQPALIRRQPALASEIALRLQKSLSVLSTAEAPSPAGVTLTVDALADAMSELPAALSQPVGS